MTTATANLKRFSLNLAAAAGNLRRNYSLEKWLTHFILSAGAILGLTGTAFVIESFARGQPLDIKDPVWSIPFRFVILPFGFLQLLVGSYCLFITRKTLSLWLIVWLVAILGVYRIGLWEAGWLYPYPFVAILTEGLSFSPRTADLIMVLGMAGLFIGSAWTLLSLWRARRANEFPKMSCPACGVHVRFAVEDLGKNIACPNCRAPITLRKPEENLKISCYFCQGHIEFPPHALGERLKCPHCKMDITLKEPATV